MSRRECCARRRKVLTRASSHVGDRETKAKTRESRHEIATLSTRFLGEKTMACVGTMPFRRDIVSDYQDLGLPATTRLLCVAVLMLPSAGREATAVYPMGTTMYVYMCMPSTRGACLCCRFAEQSITTGRASRHCNVRAGVATRLHRQGGCLQEEGVGQHCRWDGWG